MPETHEKPVVDPVKMPKLKMDKHKIATLNAWSIALAIFLGWSAIFAAIAGFTKGDWNFSIPFFGKLMGSNTEVPLIITTALFALVFGIFGFLTLKKVTDAEATKKAWGCISKVFLAFVFVYVVNMIGIVLYSLMSLGRTEDYNFDQGVLWLSSFLPTVICCVGAAAIVYMGKMISAGKTNVLRIASMIAGGIAVVAFILVFIQQLVSFYSKPESALDKVKNTDYSNLWDALRNM